MKLKYHAILLMVLACPHIQAAKKPLSIPRSVSKAFRNQGIFKGGSITRATLSNIRMAKHPEEGFERWVIDFEDTKTQKPAHHAPEFQIRYEPGKNSKDDSQQAWTELPRFIVYLTGLDKNLTDRKLLLERVKSSQLVKLITVYPPVENGDTAIEIRLSQPVLFEPHQPMLGEGRLVIDMKASS